MNIAEIPSSFFRFSPAAGDRARGRPPVFRFYLEAPLILPSSDLQDVLGDAPLRYLAQFLRVWIRTLRGWFEGGCSRRCKAIIMATEKNKEKTGRKASIACRILFRGQPKTLFLRVFFIAGFSGACSLSASSRTGNFGTKPEIHDDTEIMLCEILREYTTNLFVSLLASGQVDNQLHRLPVVCAMILHSPRFLSL